MINSTPPREKSEPGTSPIDYASSLYGFTDHNNKEIYVKGHRFYPRLANGPRSLINSRDHAPGNFILAKDHYYHNATTATKCFASFHSYLDVFHFIDSVPETQRCFYEVIPSARQKPHFDIDIEIENGNASTSDRVLNNLRNAISVVFAAHNVTYSEDQHLVIFNSHIQSKRSYHVILNGFFHDNNLEAKAFYNLVIAAMPEADRTFVDHSVYSNNQQFRLLSCHKINKINVKRLDDVTPWQPSDYETSRQKDLRIFEASLITFVNESMSLPSFIKKEAPKHTSINLDPYYEDMVDAFQRSQFAHDYEIRDNDNISSSSNSNSRIELKRLHPAFCKLHQRVHEHENAFMFLSKSGNIMVRCGRSTTGEQSIIIGSLKTTVTDEDTTEDNNDNSDNSGFFINGVKVESVTEVQAATNVVNNATSAPGANNNILRPLSSFILAGQRSHLDERLCPAKIKHSNDLKTFNNRSSTHDDLLKFTTNHLTVDNLAFIPLDDMLHTYQEYCLVNNITCIHADNVNGKFSLELKSVNPLLTTTRKRTVDSVRQRGIKGYKFINLSLMKALSVPVQRTLQITTPEVSAIIPAINYIPMQQQSLTAIYGDRYQRLQVPKLSQLSQLSQYNHTLHNTEALPPYDTMTQGRSRYVLAIKAALGMGKTEAIVHAINDITGLPRDASFLAVSGRVTLLKKQQADYGDDTEFYGDAKGELIRGKRRLVVTIDSLWRVRGSFDYLILDEITSTIDQLVSFSKRKDLNVDALLERIQKTKKVIVADAFLSDTTLDWIKRIRDDVIVYENMYAKHHEKHVNVVQSPAIIHDMIVRDATNRTKIAVACGSKETAYALANFIASKVNSKIYKPQELPDNADTNEIYKIRVYTGEDAINYDPVNTEWHLFDCVIFTSVVQAGNSFTRKHFSKVYGIFTSASFGPETAVQMLFRIRRTLTHEINICVTQNDAMLKFPSTVRTMHDMRDYIKRKDTEAREDFCRGIRTSYVTDAINYEHIYFDIYSDTRYRDLSGKRDYLWTTLTLLKSQGLTFGMYIGEEEWKKLHKADSKQFKECMKSINGDVKSLKQQRKVQGYKDVCEAPVITELEASALRLRSDLTASQKLALRKQSLRQRYKHELTPEFVATVIEHSTSHTNVTICKTLSGTMDETTKLQHMHEIIANFAERPIPNEHPDTDVPHITARLTATDKLQRCKNNLHAVNILRIYGIQQWLPHVTRNLPQRIVIQQVQAVDNVLQRIIAHDPATTSPIVGSVTDPNNHEISAINEISKAQFEASNTVVWQYLRENHLIDNAYDSEKIRTCVNDILKCLDIKILKRGKTGNYYVKLFWVLDDDGIVRPLKL